jgi:phosphatidate phosphatase PAH1
VKLVLTNDESLINLRDEMMHVPKAENVIFDSIVNDLKNLEREFADVHEIVISQAEELEKAGKCQDMSIQELREQRTSLRSSYGGIQHFNQIDHHTGRTIMERFFCSAEESIKNAMELAEKVQEKYSSLLDFLCEKDMAPHVFFGTLRRFLDEFEVATRIVERDETARVSIGFLCLCNR